MNQKKKNYRYFEGYVEKEIWVFGLATVIISAFE